MRCFLCVLLLAAGLVNAHADIKIGLIGDSTVAQQSGWGPAFADCFKQGVEVHNHAVNGATLESLSKRLDQLLALKPDYVLIQFGHNDQKRYDPKVYSAHLKRYIERVQAAKAQPIVISSVIRRTFDDQGKVIQPVPKSKKFAIKLSLTDYADAALALAKQMKVRAIDLHRLSMAHHNKIGLEQSRSYDFKKGDSTHFNRKGAGATAALILPDLCEIVPELKALLK